MLHSLVLLVLTTGLCSAADLTLLVIDQNSYLANRTAAELDVGVSIEVVAAGELETDVMVNASGLYRDLYPGKQEFIDQAAQLALRQTDGLGNG